MPEAEGSQEQAVTQESQAASAPAQEQTQEAQTSTSGVDAGASQEASEKTVPYPRFHEVIDQRNRERELREQYEARIRDLEMRASGAGRTEEDATVQRLVKKLDMSPEAAKEIVEAQRDIARAERAKGEERMRQYEIMSWNDSLKAQYPDYKELVPDMEKAFANLPPHLQGAIASSRDGLEMFYKNVKSELAEKRAKANFTAGANEAYRNKGFKQAVAALPGQSSTQASSRLTRKALREMSDDEFTRRKSEINEALRRGIPDQ